MQLLLFLLTTLPAWGQTTVIKREKTDAEKKGQLERDKKQAAEKKQKAEEAERKAAEQKAVEMRKERQKAIADSINKAIQDSIDAEINKKKHIEDLLTKAQDYLKGNNGLKKSINKADSCYIEAANIGSVKAMYDVADMWYRYGLETSLRNYQKEYFEKAFSWWSKAANEHHCDSAKYQLAICYYHGIGIDDNYTIAWQILNELSVNGNVMANDFLNSHPYLLDMHKINIEVDGKYGDLRSVRIRNESTKEIFEINDDLYSGRTHIWAKNGDIIEFYDTDDSGYRSKTVTIKDTNSVLKVKLRQKVRVEIENPFNKKTKTIYK